MSREPSTSDPSGDHAALAHALNNPLTAVIANLDIALRDLAELSGERERCEAIESRLCDARLAAERLHRMLRDLTHAGVPPEPVRATPRGPTLVAPRRARVLVVDDEHLITTAVHRTLSFDHDVTALPDAQQALSRMQGGERFDVILCDLMMPQMTGMDLHFELIRLAPDQAARMVFLTGGVFTLRARTFLDEVPNLRMEKPFDTRSLRALVNDQLR